MQTATLSTFTNKFQGHVKLITGAVVAALVLIFLFVTVNGVYNTGVGQEQRLKTQYLDNQNYLSTYVSGFYEQTGVAKAAGTQLDQVLLDAVKGRYEKTSAGGGGYTVNSPFFNALHEAYPETSTAALVSLWGKVQDYVSAGREGYRNTQSKLLDMLRVYDTWRQTGLINRVIVSALGYPSQNLEARFGANILRGQDALDKMYQIVLTGAAEQAYENGTLEPLQP